MIECSIQIFHAADNNVLKLRAIKPYSNAEFEYNGVNWWGCSQAPTRYRVHAYMGVQAVQSN